jgi:N-acetylmuramoyl-L-alanine amidase
VSRQKQSKEVLTLPKGCSNPGHGGKDSGALSSKSQEKDINLRVSLKFAKRMRDQGFEMVETRTNDTFVGLNQIASIANSNGVDFFQSNHCNAGGGHGFEIYALPGGRAVEWARVMEKHLAEALGIPNRGVKTNQKFYVLVNTKMPAILIELAFLDMPSDEALLLNDEWQNKAVEAMVQAWCEIYHVAYRSPNQPAPPPQPPQPPQPPPVGDGKPALAQEALNYLKKVEELVKKLNQ